MKNIVLKLIVHQIIVIHSHLIILICCETKTKSQIFLQLICCNFNLCIIEVVLKLSLYKNDVSIITYYLNKLQKNNCEKVHVFVVALKKSLGL
jgi:hypothetical protein